MPLCTLDSLYFIAVITTVINSFVHARACVSIAYFVFSPRAVVTMFSERGWSTLLNDDIIDTVLLVAHTVS